MKIISIFKDREVIPRKYTCDGEDINPPLQIIDIPVDTKSLGLICDDPDAPGGDFVHWIIFNINPRTNKIEENSVPIGTKLGINDFGKLKYGGPCPPSGTHRYFFKVYALDFVLNIPDGINKKRLLAEIQGHIIDKTQLIGLYSR